MSNTPDPKGPNVQSIPEGWAPPTWLRELAGRDKEEKSVVTLTAVLIVENWDSGDPEKKLDAYNLFKDSNASGVERFARHWRWVLTDSLRPR